MASEIEADEFELEEFICERCTQLSDDTSYQPLCVECYNETEGEGYDVD